MKKYTLRFRAVDKGIWQNIQKGRKTVETRAATEKFRAIKTGDTLILVCTGQKFEKLVKHAQIFKSVAALLKK